MMPTHELWRSILECEDRNQLSSGAWKALYTIAERMGKEDFSTGNKSDLNKKLIKALGYSGREELKEESNLQNKIETINKCIRIAKEKYNNSLSRMFEKETIWLVDGCATQKGGIRKFYRILKSIGVSRKNVGDNVLSLEKILFDDVLDEGTPLDKFREERRTHLVTMKLKAGLKRRKNITPDNKTL